MLHKFALAFKSKATEFFAEEDDGHARGAKVPSGGFDPAGAAGDITGPRVAKPGGEEPPPSSPIAQRALVSSLFVTVSSFHAAYLHLQATHEPFRLDGIKDADRAAVSHLQRLSDLRREYWGRPSVPDGAASSGLPLTSHLEAEVLENQSTLRKFETFFNKLQLEVDQKDAEACNLKQQLDGIETCNLHMERKLGTLSTSAAIDEGEAKPLLSVGVFDTLLTEACKAAHRFTKTLIDLLRTSGWDLEAMAKSIYPGVEFRKRGHLGYALLSYICLGMFSGFGTGGFEGDGSAPSGEDLEQRRRESLRQFVEQCLGDPIDLLNASPGGDFGRFCERKYHLLVHPDTESSVLLGQLHRGDTAPGLRYPTSPLHEPFVGMCSLVWMLHKLAMAFDRPVEIFQVPHGADFSMVYMENAVRRRPMWALLLDGRRKRRPKVGFTVVPGFRIGGVVIQCRIYAANHR